MSKLFSGFDWKAFINDPAVQIALVLLLVVACVGIFYPGGALVILAVASVFMIAFGAIEKKHGNTLGFQKAIVYELLIIGIAVLVIAFYFLTRQG